MEVPISNWVCQPLLVCSKTHARVVELHYLLIGLVNKTTCSVQQHVINLHVCTVHQLSQKHYFVIPTVAHNYKIIEMLKQFKKL